MEATSSTPVPGQNSQAGFDRDISVLQQIHQLFNSLDFTAHGLSLLEGPHLRAMVELGERVGQQIDTFRVRIAHQTDQVTRIPGVGSSYLSQVGARNPIDFLQQTTGLAAATLSRRVRLGRATATETSLTGTPIEPRFPAVAAGLESGRLSVEGAETIIRHLDARSLRAVADPADLALAEIGLVESATGTGPQEEWAHHTDSLTVMCQVMATYLDQDGPRPIDHQVLGLRAFTIGETKNGLTPITGHLMPDIAALLARVLETVTNPRTTINQTDPHSTTTCASTARTERCARHQEPLFDQPGKKAQGTSQTDPEAALTTANDCPDCQELHAAEVAEQLDTRSPGAKRHDAFASLLGAIARHPDTPLIGGAPVTVLVQTTERHLETALGNLPAEKHSGLAAKNDRAHFAPNHCPESAPAVVAEFDSTEQEPVAPQTTPTAEHQRVDGSFLHGHDGTLTGAPWDLVRHASCSGAMQRVTLSQSGSIAKIEINNRIFDANQRKALILRDGGCVIPGCMIPATWCEAHHVVEWALGGPTHIDNGVLLCWYHHRTIDHSGWKIKMINGTPYVKTTHWTDPAQKWRRARPPTAVPDFKTKDIADLCAKLFATDNTLTYPCPEAPEYSEDSEDSREPD